MMKAFSIWQPWASLFAAGAKTIETRSWPTKQRGEFLICAAKKWDGQLRDFLSMSGPQTALWPYLSSSEGWDHDRIGPIIGEDLPFGQAVAIGTMVSCIETTRLHPNQYKREEYFGDYSPGRYAWIFSNIRAIKPFDVKGKQGIFNIDIPFEV